MPDMFAIPELFVGLVVAECVLDSPEVAGIAIFE
jgi:hypothetical protein